MTWRLPKSRPRITKIIKPRTSSTPPRYIHPTSRSIRTQQHLKQILDLQGSECLRLLIPLISGLDRHNFSCTSSGLPEVFPTMVSGWERINNKKSTPNKNIVFIKPIAGPTEKIAQDYLERIAAQCLPIMNKHHLAAVSLEEYEPNREFWGRNFNSGEIIQLVLRSPSTGHCQCSMSQSRRNNLYWSFTDSTDA